MSWPVVPLVVLVAALGQVESGPRLRVQHLGELIALLSHFRLSALACLACSIRSLLEDRLSPETRRVPQCGQRIDSSEPAPRPPLARTRQISRQPDCWSLALIQSYLSPGRSRASLELGLA